jgi:hypothetical protein
MNYGLNVIFLENEMMRGTVPREISLEENRVYVTTLMIHELIPPMFVHEHTIPTFEVRSSLVASNLNEASVIQETKVSDLVIDDEED